MLCVVCDVVSSYLVAVCDVVCCVMLCAYRAVTVLIGWPSLPVPPAVSGNAAISAAEDDRRE